MNNFGYCLLFMSLILLCLGCNGGNVKIQGKYYLTEDEVSDHLYLSYYLTDYDAYVGVIKPAVCEYTICREYIVVKTHPIENNYGDIAKSAYYAIRMVAKTLDPESYVEGPMTVSEIGLWAEAMGCKIENSIINSEKECEVCKPE